MRQTPRFGWPTVCLSINLSLSALADAQFNSEKLFGIHRVPYTLDEGETSHHSISFPLHPLRSFSYSSKINGAEKDWKYPRLKSTWLSTWLQSTQLTEFFIFFVRFFFCFDFFLLPTEVIRLPSPLYFFSCVPGYKEWTHHIDLESEWEIERERDEKWWALCHAKLPNNPALTKNGAAAECNEISFKLWLSSPFVIR